VHRDSCLRTDELERLRRLLGALGWLGIAICVRLVSQEPHYTRLLEPVNVSIRISRGLAVAFDKTTTEHKTYQTRKRQLRHK
jgi:hypothetical protein